MAEFVVNTDQLRSNADRIAALQRELDSVAVRLGAMQLGSVLQIKASSALIARVGDCKWAAAHQSDDLGKLARGLDEIALLYDNVENNLTDPKTQAEVQAQADAGTSSSSSTSEEDMSFWDALCETFPFLECLGIPVEWVGRIVGGLGDIFAYGVSAVTNVIGSAIDNISEFADNMFSEQFWFEFLGEAAIDFGTGFLVAAGVTAVATMLFGPVGTVGGIACSVIAAGVCYLADAICTWITGDDISEIIIDGLWAVNEWIESGVEQIVDVAGDVIDAAGEFIDNTIDAAGEVIDNTIDAAGEFIDSTIDAAGEFIDDTIDAAGEFIDNTVEAAEEFVEETFDAVQEGAEALWNGASEFVDSILPW